MSKKLARHVKKAQWRTLLGGLYDIADTSTLEVKLLVFKKLYLYFSTQAQRIGSQLVG